MKRFKILYADPPWSFATWSERGQGKAPSQYYTCMSIKDICALRIEGRHVSELAEDDSVLFLWVTQPMLPQALKVIDAWEFTYKTVAFVWIKMPRSWQPQLNLWGEPPRPRIGLGFHTRSSSEQCWLATRGRGYKRAARNVEQVLLTPVREHSRKPDEIADRIVRLVGDVPRIELFARTARQGWDVWGNETKKFATNKGEQNLVRHCGKEPHASTARHSSKANHGPQAFTPESRAPASSSARKMKRGNKCNRSQNADHRPPKKFSRVNPP